MPAKKKTSHTKALEFEYVTSAVSLLQNDGIVIHVVNDSASSENTHVIIYQNTGAGALVATDSGTVGVVPTWTWGLGFTLAENGEYWARIQTSSECLIPKVSFERFTNSVWVPVVSYRPGDFATFTLLPTRKRVW